MCSEEIDKENSQIPRLSPPLFLLIFRTMAMFINDDKKCHSWLVQCLMCCVEPVMIKIRKNKIFWPNKQPIKSFKKVKTYQTLKTLKMAH